MRPISLALIAALFVAVGTIEGLAASKSETKPASPSKETPAQSSGRERTPAKPAKLAPLSIVDFIPPIGTVFWDPIALKLEATIQSRGEKDFETRFPIVRGIGLKRNNSVIWPGDIVAGATEKPDCSENSYCSFEPNTETTIDVVVSNLSMPGNYEGRLILLGKDGRNKEEQLNFWIRRPWWIAALIIFVGASGSIGVRWWFGSGQKKQLLRYRSARARESLQQLAEKADLDDDPTLDRLVAVLINEANEIDEEIGSLLPQTDDKRIDRFMRKIGLVRRWYAGNKLHNSSPQPSAQIETDLLSFAHRLAQPNLDDTNLNELEIEISRLWTAIGDHLAANPPARPMKAMAMAAQSSAGEFDSITAIIGFSPRQQSSDWIARHIGIIEAAILLFVLFVAILVGINQLWIPNLGWGSLTDILTALVWGLGLQLLGTNAIDSVLKLAGKP